MRKDHKNTAPKITAELNDHFKNLVFEKNCEKGTAQNRISQEGCNQKTIKINLKTSKCFHNFFQILHNWRLI